MPAHKVEVVEEAVVKTVATRVMKTVVVDAFSLVVVVVRVVPLVARVYPTTPLAKTAIISKRATSEFFILGSHLYYASSCRNSRVTNGCHSSSEWIRAC